MSKRLTGKSAVVTGAGRGIGRGIALALADEGAQVVVNDLGGESDGTGASKTPADDVVKEIKERGGKAVSNYGNVASFADAENMIKAAVENFGKIDIMVNVAGNDRGKMVFNMSEEDWDVVIACHLKGTFNTVRFASQLMRQQRSGRIINCTSAAGLIGDMGHSNYSAAKAGIFGLTRACALELGKYGITANCFMPAASTRMAALVTEEIIQRRKDEGFDMEALGVELRVIDPPAEDAEDLEEHRQARDVPAEVVLQDHVHVVGRLLGAGRRAGRQDESQGRHCEQPSRLHH